MLSGIRSIMEMNKNEKIVHIITGLGSGGAEHMLYRLLNYSDKEKYYHEVISLTNEGVYGKK